MKPNWIMPRCIIKINLLKANTSTLPARFAERDLNRFQFEVEFDIIAVSGA